MANLYFCEACATRKGNVQLDGYSRSEESAPSIRCPRRCGKQAVLRMRDIDTVHVAVADDAGPIQGADGRRWFIACAPSEDRFGMWHHTDNPEAGTCQACLNHPIVAQMVRESRREKPIIAVRNAGR